MFQSLDALSEFRSLVNKNRLEIFKQTFNVGTRLNDIRINLFNAFISNC